NFSNGMLLGIANDAWNLLRLCFGYYDINASAPRGFATCFRVLLDNCSGRLATVFFANVTACKTRCLGLAPSTVGRAACHIRDGHLFRTYRPASDHEVYHGSLFRQLTCSDTLFDYRSLSPTIRSKTESPTFKLAVGQQLQGSLLGLTD